MTTQEAREHIYLCSLMWDGLWIVQQPICNEIQKGEPVLFVERPVSVFTVIRYPDLWRRLFAWTRGPRRVSINLRVLAPLPLFHLGHRFPWLFRIEFEIQRWWILLWASHRPTGGRVLWLDNPLYECAIGRMRESISVYHTPDEVGEFRTSHRPTVTRLEHNMLRKVSVVFAAAEELARVRRSRNPRTFAIWNAIDTSNFEAEVPEAEFSDVEATPTPRVGFVGVLDTWVDLALLEATALALPKVSIVIVGPSRVNDRAVRALPNVHFLGARHRRLVPGILRRVSASLVPFVANALTENIVPAKVFEALAAGIVPVCTAFSRNLDVLEQQHLVLVARSAPQFIEMVGEAIRGDTPTRRAELAAFGLRQTWSDRWRLMKEILERLESDGPSGVPEHRTRSAV
jgi:glycosyltransferase involved in cell wall biosynthesis